MGDHMAHKHNNRSEDAARPLPASSHNPRATLVRDSLLLDEGGSRMADVDEKMRNAGVFPRLPRVLRPSAAPTRYIYKVEEAA